MNNAAGRRYSTGAMILHWVIAIAVIANWQIAEKAEHVPKAEHDAVMAWHFTLGITILLLSVLRLIWRMTHTPPPLASTLAPWERAAARFMHGLFYVLLIGLPLGGWLGLSGYGASIDFWGLFNVPALPVGFGKETGHDILELHGTGGSIFIYLIGLHILAALKHTFFDKDGNLFRMLPFGNVKA